MRVRILNNITNYCTRPPIGEMLTYGLLTVFEATCSTTDRWPDYIYKHNCPIAKTCNIPRTFFYEPAPPPEHPDPLKWRFNLATMGVEFLSTYKAMKYSMAHGELAFCTASLGIDDEYDDEFRQGISYLVNPDNVTWWASLVGFDLQTDLQDAIGLSLMKGKCDTKALRKVKIKVTGQFLRHYFPKQRISFYCKHDWMRDYVEKPEWKKNDNSREPKDPYQTIRKYLNELRDPNINRKPGNRSDENIENELYYPKALKEAINVDSSGLRRYYIPTLKIVINTAAHLLLRKFLEESIVVLDQSKNGLDLFLEDFMKNEVISLYTENAPPRVLEYLDRFAYWAVSSLFLSGRGESD